MHGLDYIPPSARRSLRKLHTMTPFTRCSRNTAGLEIGQGLPEAEDERGAHQKAAWGI